MVLRGSGHKRRPPADSESVQWVRVRKLWGLYTQTDFSGILRTLAFHLKPSSLSGEEEAGESFASFPHRQTRCANTALRDRAWVCCCCTRHDKMSPVSKHPSRWQLIKGTEKNKSGATCLDMITCPNLLGLQGEIQHARSSHPRGKSAV